MALYVSAFSFWYEIKVVYFCFLPNLFYVHFLYKFYNNISFCEVVSGIVLSCFQFLPMLITIYTVFVCTFYIYVIEILRIVITNNRIVSFVLAYTTIKLFKNVSNYVRLKDIHIKVYNEQLYNNKCILYIMHKYLFKLLIL